MEMRRLTARPGPDLFTRIPAADPGEPVACTRCSANFDTDPTIAVGCPTCGAPEGERCRLPAQGGFHRSHYTRSHIALRSGRMSACEALTWDRLHALPVRLRAAPCGSVRLRPAPRIAIIPVHVSR